MKLLLDEMWTPRIAEALRRRGHNVVAVAERADLRTRPDSVIFERARAEGWAIFTEDAADFRELAAAAFEAGLEPPPLIFTSNRGWPRQSAHRIGRLVEALDALLSEQRDLAGEHWLR